MLPVGLYGTRRVFSLSASIHSAIQREPNTAVQCCLKTDFRVKLICLWEMKNYGLCFSLFCLCFHFRWNVMPCRHCDAKTTASVPRDVAHDRAVQMFFCLVVFRRKWREAYLLTGCIQTMFVLLNRNVWSQVSDVLLKSQEWELRKTAITSDLSSFVEQGLWLGLPGSAEKKLLGKCHFFSVFFIPYMPFEN